MVGAEGRALHHQVRQPADGHLRAAPRGMRLLCLPSACGACRSRVILHAVWRVWIAHCPAGTRSTS